MEFWVLILTLWALYRWVHSRIQRGKEDERFARVIEALNRFESRLGDLKKLETRVAELEQRLASSAPQFPAAEKPLITPAPTAPPPAPKPVEFPPAVPVPGSLDTLKQSTPVLPPPAVEPVEPPISPPPAPQPTPPRPAPPSFTLPSRPAPVAARERSSQLEEVLGTNWLNKLGIVALVIGISLFLAYKFPSLSNPAKIALCYLVSFAILGTGVYLERLERYRVFARALIGGGWALTFFVTYAMHFVPFTRVIDTQWVDLVLLFLVAVVMVVHTLRYDSQVVTGLAFLLAFTTVGISQNTIYSLSAGAILALGLVAIVHRRRWFELEVFGILASYGNHFIWLAKIILPMAGHHRMFPEFLPSTLLLTLYWAIYRWSYIARPIESAYRESVSTLAAILNTSLLLFLFKYQSVRPEFAFYGLLVLGTIELALGQLPATRKRRIAFAILSTIGIVLLVAAIPFKYSGMDTAVIWLAEAQMLLFAGVFTKEILFRRFGLLVALLTSGDMLVNQALPALSVRFSRLFHGVYDRFTLAISTHDYQLAISFFVAALLFYTDALVIPRRWKDVIVIEAERVYFRGLSYLASLMLFVCLWLALPFSWTGVGWAAAALLLVLLGRRFSSADLAYQGHLLVLAGFVRTLLVSIDDTREWHHFTLRFLTFTLTATLLYLCAYVGGPPDFAFAGLFSALHTWCGSILIAVLAFEEVSSPWIAVAWSVFALLLLIIGDRVKRIQLHFQAYLLSLAALFQAIFVSLDAAGPFSFIPGLSLRLVTVSLVAAAFYLCGRWAAKGEFGLAPVAAAAYTWAASSLVVLLIDYEAAPRGVALVWALFALALFEFGMWRKSPNFRSQAYALLFLSFLRIVAFNLSLPAVQLLEFTLPIAFLFYYAYLRLTPLSAGKDFALDRRLRASAALCYLGSATLALFADSYFPAGARLVAWAVLALAFIGIAWAAHRYVFLHHSVLLAFLVSFRAFASELQDGGRPGFSGTSSPVFYVSIVAAILFAAQAFAFPLRARFTAAGAESSSADKRTFSFSEFFARPEQIYFFLPFLLVTFLILNEVSFARVTIAWGIEAVFAFAFALLVGERSFRLAALFLLLLCVAKIGLLDVWRLHGSDRYVTLIILGVALLLVSYLYTRYSEAIRRYL